MTVNEIKMIREINKELELATDFYSMEPIIGKIKGFYNERFNIELKARVHNTQESYIERYLNYDKEAIKSFLNSIISKNSCVEEVNRILDLIEEGEKCSNPWPIKSFIEKVYTAYSDKIKFDESTKKILAPSRTKMYTTDANENILQGVIIKLQQYANELLTPKMTQSSGGQTINVNNYIKNDISIDITVDNAIKIAEDAGLADWQYNELLNKLNEIKGIGLSNESKGKKWNKLKEIMKWVAEQGIQAASIIVPVICDAISK